MAAPSSATVRPATGGNALAALFAAAAASMQRQQQQIQQQQEQQQSQLQQQPQQQPQQNNCDDDTIDDNVNNKNNNGSIKFRQLETWQDEGYKIGDESLYRELMDTDDANGWSADEMFKYNEKIHNVTTAFNDKTMSRNYTIPLPDNSNKTTKSRNRKRLAAKIAKEIQETSTIQGRLTPESSDDDEIYENERLRLRSSKMVDQNQLNNCLNRMSTPTSSLSSSNSPTSSTNPSQINNSSTPSNSSSSRNILRKSLIDSSTDMNNSIMSAKVTSNINRNFSYDVYRGEMFGGRE